jgi:hypothetical protein
MKLNAFAASTSSASVMKVHGLHLLSELQEKWSDLIRLRLPPTKQMDHLPIPPSDTTYVTYQEERKI